MEVSPIAVQVRTIREHALPLRRPADQRLLARAARSLVRQRRGLFGLTITLLAVVTAVFAQALAPHDPLQQEITARLRPPVWVSGDATYLLGTDALGRDLLSRIMYGTRISIVVGLASVLVAGVVGTLVGLVAGYLGGAVDAVAMRLVDTWQAVPVLVLAIAVAVMLGPGLVNVILVLGITTWVTYARIVRAQTLSLRETDLVVAARVIGAGDVRILFRYLLPNVSSSLIVVATQQVAAMILFEAALSFLGLGVQPPTPSWGGMVNDGRTYLATAWWVSTLPGGAIVLTVLGINLLGDWLRDFLDPRQKWV